MIHKFLVTVHLSDYGPLIPTPKVICDEIISNLQYDRNHLFGILKVDVKYVYSGQLDKPVGGK